jgi:hypothetical protein
MSYSKTDRSGRKDFFGVFTIDIEGRLLGIVGRNIGDKRYASRRNSNGTTYDAAEAALYVPISNATRLHIDRVVQSRAGNPCEINEAGLAGLMVSDPEGHQHFWLGEPLARTRIACFASTRRKNAVALAIIWSARFRLGLHTS